MNYFFVLTFMGSLIFVTPGFSQMVFNKIDDSSFSVQETTTEVNVTKTTIAEIKSKIDRLNQAIKNLDIQKLDYQVQIDKLNTQLKAASDFGLIEILPASGKVIP